MSDLTIICRDNQLYVDSREIARILKIKHWEILRKLKGRKNVKGYIQILTDNHLVVSEYFVPNTYKDNSGKENESFLFTRLGCDFIANKFTGEKGVVFTAKYVKRFNEMEKMLQEHNSLHWQQTRLDSKSNRRMETDEINQFIQYAKEHGSRNAEKYYIALSKLADNAVGIQPHNRDAATASQLNNLILIEHIIGEVIQIGMQQELYYKDIYKACKARIEQFREIVFFTQNKNALI